MSKIPINISTPLGARDGVRYMLVDKRNSSVQGFFMIKAEAEAKKNLLINIEMSQVEKKSPRNLLEKFSEKYGGKGASVEMEIIRNYLEKKFKIYAFTKMTELENKNKK